MKKKVLAMMMVAALGVAGFAGCGDKAETNAPESNVEQDAGAADAGAEDAGAADAGAEDASAADAGAADAGAADAGTEDTGAADAGTEDAGATVEDWYNSQIDEIHAIEDEINASADQMGCTASILVDGNALVFLYTLTEEFPTDEESLATLAESYDTMFETQKSVFESLCSQIKSETGVEDAVIRIAAANPDGTELYSRDFSN